MTFVPKISALSLAADHSFFSLFPYVFTSSLYIYIYVGSTECCLIVVLVAVLISPPIATFGMLHSYKFSTKSE